MWHAPGYTRPHPRPWAGKRRRWTSCVPDASIACFWYCTPWQPEPVSCTGDSRVTVRPPNHECGEGRWRRSQIWQWRSWRFRSAAFVRLKARTRRSPALTSSATSGARSSSASDSAAGSIRHASSARSKRRATNRLAESADRIAGLVVELETRTRLTRGDGDERSAHTPAPGETHAPDRAERRSGTSGRRSPERNPPAATPRHNSSPGRIALRNGATAVGLKTFPCDGANCCCTTSSDAGTHGRRCRPNHADLDGSSVHISFLAGREGCGRPPNDPRPLGQLRRDAEHPPHFRRIP